jgi:hypothetical protein
MNQKKFLALTATTAVLLVAGVWLSMHRSGKQSDLGGAAVFADLKPALGEVSEVRLSKGDGSRTTLRKSADGWTVVERQYPADASRVRELVLNLAGLKVVERKTKDPANYAMLGVEAPDKPTAGSTLVEVVAGQKTWPLIVGKAADGRAIYVRKPAEAESLLATPFVTVDPDQKRWIDRLLVDIPGQNVHDVSVKFAGGQGYTITRAKRGDSDLSVNPIPKGRKPVTSMSLGSQLEALAGFNFEDVHEAKTPAATSDTATYRTFDGQVIEFSGRRDGDKAFVSIAASRDPALAAQFPEPAAAAPAAAPTPALTPAATPAIAKPADKTAERLATRTRGVEFEIPAYKYEAVFRKPEELLEKLPEPAKKPEAAKTK